MLVLAVLVTATPTLAQAGDGFVNLVGIPGLQSGSEPDMETYINSLLRIAIIAAALVAVIKLILAGAKYVLSDLVTSKENAKRDVYSALIGLLIVLAAVTILRTINPDILNLEPLTAPPRPDIPDYVPDDDNEQRPTECGIVDLVCHTRCADAGGVLGQPDESTNTRPCTYPSDDPNEGGVSPSDIPPCTATNIEQLGACRSACVNRGFGIHSEGRLGTPDGVTITCVGRD